MNLTPQQLDSLKHGEVVALDLDNTPCVVMRKDVFEKVKQLAYDDNPPTDEEIANLAWEAGKSIGWDDPIMDEYNNYDARRKS